MGDDSPAPATAASAPANTRHRRIFRTTTANEPVRAWLKTLSPADRQAIGTAARKVENGWPLGMPTCAALGDGLREIRTTLQNRIARILSRAAGPQVILLHGFIKKSQTTPKTELDTTRMRQADLLARLRAVTAAPPA